MKIIKKYNETSLVVRIICGLAIGLLLALTIPKVLRLEIIGNIFIGALRGIAPILVFALVTSALVNGSGKMDRRFGSVIFLYMLSTFLAAFVAVAGSFLFPQTIALGTAYKAESVPSGIFEVISNLLLKLVDNPINALAQANYIGILFWAIIFAFALKSFASESTKTFWIINMAPFGVMGLVYQTVSANGLGVFMKYGSLLGLLVGCMLLVALVVDPLIAFIALKRNPYPLVFRCLKESGVTAFFTRSSAANIPVNMAFCEKLGLDKDMYSISIPLGATINMDGAAITITVMTLATANTLGIHPDLVSALMLSILSTLAACGSSGVTGGSLLLIPMACSLFNIPNSIAMQVVGVGIILGVVQDSVETALNSSGDVMFAATAEFREWQKKGKRLPDFMYSRKERAKFNNTDNA